MVGVGINLVETTFENLGPPMFRTAPDLAEVIYYVHRCGHAHGDEIPIAFATRPTIGPVGSEWLLGPNILQMPHRIIWALASIAVFSRVNDGLRGSGGDRYLTWAKERYPIAEWWGREKDIRPIAAGWNTIRVKFDKLAALRMADPATGGMEFVLIGDPMQDRVTA